MLASYIATSVKDALWAVLILLCICRVMEQTLLFFCAHI